MKLKISLVLLCILGLHALSHAQNRLQFSDLYFVGGASGVLTGPLGNFEVNNLERNLFQPNTLRPNNNTFDIDWENRVRLNTQIGLMAGWNVRGTRLGRQKIRIGFTAGSYHVNWDNNYQAKDVYRIDTLVSQQTGEEYYIDSTRVRTLDYEHIAQMFNLHFDYLVYLNPRNKLTFYTGVGAQLGISLSNTVTATYYEYDAFDNYDLDYYKDKKDYDHKYDKDEDNNYFRNTKTLSPTTNISAHALVGFNYRLSKRSRFLRHVHLFNELQLGLQLNQMEIIDPSIGFNVGFQMGMRISFNRPKSKTPVKRRKRY